MREALSGLTVRGRAFLAAGITAIVCAVFLGQDALTRVGVLVLALPLVTAYVLGRSRYRLALVRTLSPQIVVAGQPARLNLTLTNEGKTPSGALLLEDHVPYVLGTRPRFVLDGIGQGWRRHASYQVRSDVRGKFEIGPMSVRVSDPFGLVELGRAFHTTVSLTVTPRTVPLPQIPLGGAWTGSGDNRPRAFATGSAEDVTVREYRRGDELRRVHWRSSAKMGELMVRREEQPWQSRATLFLDNRLRAHRGQGIASSLEAAVSAAASIAVNLSQRGFMVRFVTAAGEDPNSAWHQRDADLNTAPLLEALAVVQAIQLPRIDTSWLAEASQGGLIVAVVGGLEDHDLPVLRRMHHHAAASLAIAVDVEAWGGTTRRTGGATATLAQQGWRAVGLGPRDRLETVWQELGRTSRSRPSDLPHDRPHDMHGRGGGHVSTSSGSTLSFQRPLGRLRGGLRDALVLALVGSFTTWVALLSWKGFAVAWGSFMGPLVTIALVVALSGALLRWLRVPGPLVVLVQLVVVGAVVSLYICGSPIPIGEAWLRMELAFQDASATAQQYAAPVPRGVPPIDPLLIAGGAACMLLVDIMAGTLRRVPLAGLPLLTIYSIPVSLLGGGVSWIVFTFTTIGFLLMLYLQESRQIARWGRPLGQEAGGDPSGFGVSNGALRSSAGAIGAAATALAIVVPIFIPTFGIHAVRQRVRPGWRRPDQDREPDRRPQARPPAGPGRRHDHGRHRRPRPELPAHLGAQPVLRQRVEPWRPHGDARPARAWATCRRSWA